MVTVVTQVRVKGGREDEWDEVFAKRVQSARGHVGFESVQLCQPESAPSVRVIVGTWQTHEDWKSWHEDQAFRETRGELEQIDDESSQSLWYTVLVEERR
jgi:heme-degrading monooxygenase HmoA